MRNNESPGNLALENIARAGRDRCDGDQKD